MKRLAIGLILAALLGASAAGAAPQPFTVSADAVELIDGDTFVVAGVHYRLVGADTPEIRGAACYAERRLGEIARNQVRAWLDRAGAARVEPTGEGQPATARFRHVRVYARLFAGERDVAELLIAARYSLLPGERRSGWCGGLYRPH